MKKLLIIAYRQTLEVKRMVEIQYNQLISKVKNPPLVKTTDETLSTIINSKLSVSRYGDGEFAIMNGQSLLFQQYDPELSSRLKEILISERNNHIVCIPYIFNNLSRFNENAENYWTNYLQLHRYKMYKHLNMKKQYYDAFITRLYADLKDKTETEMRFNMVKQLWSNRDVLIVEGTQSRLGIGNDLFANTKSLQRIICPNIDAYTKYKEILHEIKRHDQSKMILIALGPTATVLAYDLSTSGYHAVDIGHIDIEYEWFLEKAIEKKPVKNKYIGEMMGGTNVDTISDKRYESEIIKRIG